MNDTLSTTPAMPDDFDQMIHETKRRQRISGESLKKMLELISRQEGAKK